MAYKGLPPPIITDFFSRETSRSLCFVRTEFHIGKNELVGTTRTYVDAPFHRDDSEKDFTHIHLSSNADLDGNVVRKTKRGKKERSTQMYSKTRELETKLCLFIPVGQKIEELISMPKVIHS